MQSPTGKGVPVEARSYARPFLLLAIALAAATAWAIYDDCCGDRREWKRYQAEWNRAAGRAGLALAEGGIRRIAVPEVGIDDRCETCHLGMREQRAASLPAAWMRPHPRAATLLGLHRLQRFGCTSCHQGQGRATTVATAHLGRTTLRGGDEQARSSPSLLRGGFVESGCLPCHLAEAELSVARPCNLDSECATGETCRRRRLPVTLALPATAASPGARLVQAAGRIAVPERTASVCGRGDEAKGELLAPRLTAGWLRMEALGCQGCHSIPGLGAAGPGVGDGVDQGLGQRARRVGPDLWRLAAKVRPEWLVDWLADPWQKRPHTRMPRFFPEGGEPRVEQRTQQRAGESRAMAAFLLEASRPLATAVAGPATDPSLRRAGHVSQPPAAPGGDPGRGRELFANLGCTGCHVIPAEGAPGTSRAAARAETAATRAEEAARRAEMRAGRAGAATRGSPAEGSGRLDHGPDISDAGDKLRDSFVAAWLRAPRALAPAARMPSLRLDEGEVADLAAFLATRRCGRPAAGRAPGRDVTRPAAASPPSALVAEAALLPALVEQGRGLVRRYGCHGCHQIAGFEAAAGIGPDLTEFGSKELGRLDFGDVRPAAATWEAWTLEKLHSPRAFRRPGLALRMPQPQLSAAERLEVAVALRGLAGPAAASDRLHRDQDDLERTDQRGRSLLRFYNCGGCHLGVTAAAEGPLARPETSSASVGLPALAGEGGRRLPAWLFDFLGQVTPIRPFLRVRMPSFALDDGDVAAVVTTLAARMDVPFPFQPVFRERLAPESRQLAALLVQVLRCSQCHPASAPLLRGLARRVQPRWLRAWLADPEARLPGAAMPAYFAGGANPLAAVLRTQAGQATLAAAPSVAALTELAASPAQQIDLLARYLLTLE